MENLNKKFYITTAIDYVNGKPHLGHALEKIQADVLARYKRLILGDDDIYFLTGADEHGSKIFRTAEKQGKEVQSFVDENTEVFRNLWKTLNISNNDFIRTSDKKRHRVGAQALWNKIFEAGDLEKAKYSGLYCVGCEAFVTEKDLIDGKCPNHDTAPEKIEEENYFFKISKYIEDVKSKIESDELQIIPAGRKNEILAMIERGVEDISFSRPKEKLSWGVDIPNDDSQVMYVWCDALANYISALGFGSDGDDNFKKYWPADVHMIGKDILRFHAIVWPAMLLSAGLPLPKKIFVHGFLTSDGKKMSKSLGNVIDPVDLINEYGTEALRYFLLREVTPFEDGDITLEKFKEAYNANLANGLGNLVSRILTMTQNSNVNIAIAESNKDVLFEQFKTDKFSGIRNTETGAGGENFIEKKMPSYLFYEKEHFFIFGDTLDFFDFQKAMDRIMADVKSMDVFITRTEVYRKDSKDRDKNLMRLLINLKNVALSLQPFMPETSEKIQHLIKENKSPETPLFKRK
ncbi:class I tRNA ligase family protein [Patescibacteria group bacterium]|nr:class I tRNA ligase family protein [Patescibacteria group bacterium]MCG2695016.1 class I tRNA ligase family protein [Candidatus Parcubacteria bacterium]